jgi:hypothetical protein
MRVSVIGAGIVGMCAALRLKQAGHEIKVFYEDYGASSVATGVSSVKGYRKADKALFAIKVLGHSYLAELIKELEIFSGEQIVYKGVKEFFSSPEEYERILSRIERNVLPGSFEIAKDHFFYPRDFYFYVPQLIETLKSYLMDLGVVFVNRKIAESIDFALDEQKVFCIGHKIKDFFPHLSHKWRQSWGYIVHEKVDSTIHEARVMGAKAQVTLNGMCRHGSYDDIASVSSLAGYRVHDIEDGASCFSPAENTWILGGVHKSGFQLADVLARRLVLHLSL